MKSVRSTDLPCLRILVVVCFVMLGPSLTSPLTAQTVDLPAGLPYSDGPASFAGNPVVDLSLAATGSWDSTSSGAGVYDPDQWAVVFKYTSVNVPAFSTVTFQNHPKRAPVVWLVEGDVTIDGTVQLNGGFGTGSANLPSGAGPGGFRGGRRRLGTRVIQSAGYGPGGAPIYTVGSTYAAGGSYATLGGSAASTTRPMTTYGNEQILPLIGGSGGAGSSVVPRSNGGGGGGALLIVAQGTITVNGSIVARGGNTSFEGGGGSGGAIRLVASTLAGNGTIDVRGGTSGLSSIVGGAGRIRFETDDAQQSWTVLPSASSASPDDPVVLWPDSNSPTVEITAIDGLPVSTDPQTSIVNNPGLLFVDNPIFQIQVQTELVDPTDTVEVKLTRRAGPDRVATATLDPPGQTGPILNWVTEPLRLGDGFREVQASVVTGTANHHSRAVGILCSPCDSFCLTMMPGFPNPPRANPEQRRKARPGESTVLWANLNGGTWAFSELDVPYTWSITSSPNVTVTTDGDLAGVVANDRWLGEVVTFDLAPGIEQEIVTASITVDGGVHGVVSDSIEIEIVARETPGTPSLADIEIDRQIARDEGVDHLYNQPNLLQGQFLNTISNDPSDLATTSFALWALQNQGHLQSNDKTRDVCARRVERSLEYLFGRIEVLATPADLTAPRADVARGAVADGVSDLNGNGQVIGFDDDMPRGYVHPIACAAIIASGTPNRVVVNGPAAGMTYREVVEDMIDYMGHRMNAGNATWGGRGGWDYSAVSTSTRSDMSINSWMYLAMEGAQANFGITVPDWIKQEIEHALVNHQSELTGAFGYEDMDPCAIVIGRALATSGGGLSALALVQTEGPFVPVGTVLEASGSALPLDQRRSEALVYIGDQWDHGPPGQFCSGHLGNYYAMWTVARALRLTADALGLPPEDELTLVNDTPHPDPAGPEVPIPFDWERGETIDPLTGELAGPGHPREGYFPYLFRTQQRSGNEFDRGRWFSGASWMGSTLETAMAVLTLSTRVFGPPCPDGVEPTVVGLGTESIVPSGPYVLTGQAVAASSERPIVAIAINGEPVDSIDATGHFFHAVELQPGENLFHVSIFDTTCGVEAGVTIVASDPAAPEFDQFVEATGLWELSLAGTTFNPGSSQMILSAQACNATANATLPATVLLVIDSFTNPTIALKNPSGFTPSGAPFVRFQAAEPIAPGDCTDPEKLAFDNPNQAPPLFEPSWLIAENVAPVFTTTPLAQTRAGDAYAYAANAVDSDDAVVMYSLDEAPSGMAIDQFTGVVSWLPSLVDVGNHTVRLRASDGNGASGVQVYALTVLEPGTNRAPFFTTAPPTHASVGATYAYAAAAVDLDDDVLTFTLLSAPPGMSVDPITGLVDWDFATPPSTTVTLQAADGQGGVTTQSWMLSIGTVTTNPTSPQIFGTPPTQAVAGSLYVYQPVISSPDSGETHASSLNVAPATMDIDAATGLITWIPASGDLGLHSVELQVDDGAGATATQTWTIDVLASLPNRPPAITSTPSLVAVIGNGYTYDANAVDPDGDSMAFEVITPPTPAEVTIDASSGLLTWDPIVVGDHSLAVRVSDGNGGFANQTYTVTVFDSNEDPVITSTPPESAPDPELLVGDVYLYPVQAVDAEGEYLVYSLEAGPIGMTVHPLFGLVSWQPTPSQFGSFTARVRVEDPRAGFTTQEFNIDVGPDTTPPLVTISGIDGPIQLGQTVLVTVGATDDTGVVSESLSIDGVEFALDEFGQAVFTATTTGDLAVIALATDATGNVGTTSTTLTVLPPDTERPVVTVMSPAPGSMVTGPVDIVGTVSDDSPGALTWEVRLSRYDSDEFTVIASGSGAAVGVLASLDPTLLPNDSYRVQIVGDDGRQTGGIEFLYSVAGHYKVGNFSFDFSDIAFQIGGIPLAIERQYNTLDLTPGDFGVGWRLGLPGQVRDDAEESRTGQPFIDSLLTAPFVPGTRVFVTRPDGQRVGFTFQPIPLPFGFGMIPRFIPDPGVTDTLEAIDDLLFEFLLISPPVQVYAPFPLAPFNPDKFRLTNSGGVSYVIDEFAGLESIEDQNGNLVQVTPDGLESSSGVSVIFTRDSAGRITAISEISVAAPLGPSGPELLYEYDSIGNLTSFTDLDGNTSTYYYEDPSFPHHMTRLDSPLRTIVQNVFDENGRVVAQCNTDPDLGVPVDCTTFDFDAIASVQTTITEDGRRVDLFFDDRGIVVKRRVFDDSGVTFVDEDSEYDENGKLLVYTRGSSSDEYQYDEQGNLVTYIGPDGGLWTYTFDDTCHLVDSETDPQGNTHTYQYDDQCRLRYFVTPVGGVHELQYNAEGEVSDYFDPTGNHWQFLYDKQGFPALTIDPLGSTLVMQFDEAGRLIFGIDREGNRIDYEYNDSGLLVQETWDTFPPRVITYGYDDNGRLISATDPDSSTAIDYWPNGQVKSVDNSGTPDVPNVAVTYGYLNNGELVPGYDGQTRTTHVMDSLGGMTEYQYDPRYGLTRMLQYGAPEYTGPVPPPTEKVLDIQFDDEGLFTRVDRYADVAQTSPVFYTEYEYDCPGCRQFLNTLRHRRSSDDAIIHEITYGRDVIANVTSIADNQGTHDYTYDGLSRLLTANHNGSAVQPDETYEYDLSGNRVASHRSNSYVYSRDLGLGGNQLRQDDSYDYEYDLNGQLTLQTDRSTGERIEYEYDHRARLTSIRRFDAADTRLGYTDIRYDAFDRRIRTDENGTVRCFIYDDFRPILKLDESGEIIARRLYGIVADDTIAEEIDGQTHWFVTEQTGTIREAVDDAGSVLASFVCDTFGDRLASTAAFENDLTFTARELLADVSLIYFRARHYDPSLGRFTQEDPFDPFQYDYVGSNPLGRLDPSGLQPANEYRPVIPPAVNWLYVGCEAGRVVYVGISGQPRVRARAHARLGRTFRFCALQDGLTRNQARTLEQALIDFFGGPRGTSRYPRMGPFRLLNRINSIGPNNAMGLRPFADGLSRTWRARIGGFALMDLILCASCIALGI